MITFFGKKKEQVLIFGTGSGGMNFYQNNRSRYQIVGFLDNNKQKHGHKLFGQSIYAPQSLGSLSFDKIIIASDYYVEIHAQLIKQLEVDAERIEVFQPNHLINTSWWCRLKKLIDQRCYLIMCRKSGWISTLLFNLFYGRIRGSSNTKMMPFSWLDTQSDFRIHIFREAIPAVVRGPAYLDRPKIIADIVLPEVALYRIHDGQVCSVSRSVILPGNRLLIERVIPAVTNNADYSCAHLLYHGEKLALVRQDQPEYIDKGILISGGSETNYYHWMLEILSQLQFIEEMPDEYNDYPILISVSSQKISSIKTFIDAAKVSRRFIYLNNITSYRVEDLLLITPPNNLVANLKDTTWSNVVNSYVRKESIDYLRHVAFQACLSSASVPLPKRIFFARKGFIRHYNQNEIMDALSVFGFAFVYMEDLSFCEQVSLMAQAEIIVGPTGAAWTNIIFASPGTKALCWMARDAGDLSCFSNIAYVLDIDLNYLSYEVRTSNTREIYYASYTMDPNRIVSWVKNNLPEENCNQANIELNYEGAV